MVKAGQLTTVKGRQSHCSVPKWYFPF